MKIFLPRFDTSSGQRPLVETTASRTAETYAEAVKGDVVWDYNVWKAHGFPTMPGERGWDQSVYPEGYGPRNLQEADTGSWKERVRRILEEYQVGQGGLGVAPTTEAATRSGTGASATAGMSQSEINLMARADARRNRDIRMQSETPPTPQRAGPPVLSEARIAFGLQGTPSSIARQIAAGVTQPMAPSLGMAPGGEQMVTTSRDQARPYTTRGADIDMSRVHIGGGFYPGSVETVRAGIVQAAFPSTGATLPPEELALLQQQVTQIGPYTPVQQERITIKNTWEYATVFHPGANVAELLYTTASAMGGISEANLQSMVDNAWITIEDVQASGLQRDLDGTFKPPEESLSSYYNETIDNYVGWYYEPIRSFYRGGYGGGRGGGSQGGGNYAGIYNWRISITS